MTAERELKIKVKKENKPSYECMNMAETALMLADCSDEKSDLYRSEYHCNTGFIFLAFAIEAMFIFYRRQVEPGYEKTKDRKPRKEFHKETLAKCGIKNLLGSRDYQICAACLSIRDGIAHGDTYESLFEHSSSHPDDSPEQLNEILAVQSAQFREISPQTLRKGIEAAKHLDEHICDNALHVGLAADEREYGPRFIQAFGVSGTSTW